MRLVIHAWIQLDSERPCILYTDVIKGHPFIFTRRGTIPRRAVREWCADEGLGTESFDLLAAVIHILDIERQQQER